jgi:hypothetical protein
MTFMTSRTAVLTFQDCPRRRFLSNHLNGHGITGSKQSLDTFIGSVTHRGLQNLLEHARVDHDGDTRLIKRTCINQSVNVARRVFFEMLENSQGFYHKGDDYTDYEYKIDEAWALCEAFIRAFAIWRLPLFGEFYEVLEVEKEEQYWFEEPINCPECGGSQFFQVVSETTTPNPDCKICNGSGRVGGILFQAKADGLLRGRQDNKLYVLSFKTARDFTDLTMKQILHDMQGMSEIAAIEDRLNRIFDRLKLGNYQTSKTGTTTWDCVKNETGIGSAMFSYMENRILNNELDNIECYAVDYEYLLKGRYQQDPWNSGNYKWQNPLIHFWKNDGILNMMSGQRSGMDFKWKAGKGRMPAGWEKTDAWQTQEPFNNMGVEAWLDMLMSHEVQPEEGDVFQNIFRSEVIIRDRSHIEEWKVSTHAQEHNVAANLRELELAPDDKKEFVLARYFRKHTNRCHDFYGNDCPFVQICHQNLSPTELVEEGLFKIRSPHHDAEREEFKKKGFME